jgi:aromatic-L-amino-acid decarboxylase
MRLAERFAALISQSAQFELCAPHPLSIVAFRFVPQPGMSPEYLDVLNSRLPAALRRDGRIYFGSASVGSVVALRVCFINHRVTDADLNEWVGIISELANDLHSARASWWEKHVEPSAD